jgi:thiaminase/transcriptional activator TenA
MRRRTMGTGFSETLRTENAQTWSQAVEHRFVHELLDGSVPDPVMAGYLTQDYRFFDGFLALVGAAVATADDSEARLRLARFAGDISGDENTYFLRAFDALGVSSSKRDAVPDTPATAAYKNLFKETAATREYAAIIAVLVVAEWLYLDWASRAPEPLPKGFVCAEWITLHDNPGFRELVGFLRSELDRVGPEHDETVRGYFQRAVSLELAFFDSAYEPAGQR